MMRKGVKAFALVAVAFLALSGCAKAVREAQKIDNSVKRELVNINQKLISMIDDPNIAYPKSPQAVPNAYCYRTLGGAQCYAREIPGQEDRLIGYFGSRGTFPEQEQLPSDSLMTASDIPPPPPMFAAENPAPSPFPPPAAFNAPPGGTFSHDQAVADLMSTLREEEQLWEMRTAQGYSSVQSMPHKPPMAKPKAVAVSAAPEVKGVDEVAPYASAYQPEASSTAYHQTAPSSPSDLGSVPR